MEPSNIEQATALVLVSVDVSRVGPDGESPVAFFLDFLSKVLLPDLQFPPDNRGTYRSWGDTTCGAAGMRAAAGQCKILTGRLERQGGNISGTRGSPRSHTRFQARAARAYPLAIRLAQSLFERMQRQDGQSVIARGGDGKTSCALAPDFCDDPFPCDFASPRGMEPIMGTITFPSARTGHRCAP
jgi:hypothetical protein